jgi:hypothetical protein
MSILQKLTEGVRSRDMQAEGTALLNKWEATGLLEGLNEGQAKQGMAVLLENQAKELLREASSMAAGDVEGFAAVAFPIVRRVFGGLIANDIVSVQPMSLPSGLIFFLDFTHSDTRLGAVDGESIYGGNVVGKNITNGVNLDLDLAGARRDGGGHYDLGNALSSPPATTAADPFTIANHVGAIGGSVIISALNPAQKKELRYDPDILALDDGTSCVGQFEVQVAALTNPDLNRLAAAVVNGAATGDVIIRRLTKHDAASTAVVITMVNGNGAVGDLTAVNSSTLSYSVVDDMTNSDPAVPGALLAGAMLLEEPNPAGGTAGTTVKASGGLGGSATTTAMSEIDIKVDSIAVTAQTKKLKAKWSPELGQDLNAYHNLDAEVELTGILSEQIALEIDRELLGELVNGAKAGTRYWSRAPGLFVDSSGTETGASSAAPDFTGTVSEWYETLIETINDVSAQIHRKTLRGGANFVVCSPEVANILEFTSGFRASVTADQDRGTIGAIKSGSLSKKFDVYVDPYFIRNVVLIGRKGSSFLESGYVYAPYVPLQVTPTIFGTEDFIPRKGVMTRYAKQMVRPDMYGLVVVRGLLGESGG